MVARIPSGADISVLKCVKCFVGDRARKRKKANHDSATDTRDAKRQTTNSNDGPISDIFQHPRFLLGEQSRAAHASIVCFFYFHQLPSVLSQCHAAGGPVVGEKRSHEGSDPDDNTKHKKQDTHESEQKETARAEPTCVDGQQQEQHEVVVTGSNSNLDASTSEFRDNSLALSLNFFAIDRHRFNLMCMFKKKSE